MNFGIDAIAFDVAKIHLPINTLANNKYGEYLFVDKIENAGFVYGEIVNNLVYSLIEEGFITKSLNTLSLIGLL
jgi:hypothetical protein